VWRSLRSRVVVVVVVVVVIDCDRVEEKNSTSKGVSRGRDLRGTYKVVDRRCGVVVE
jgi:hypothetical protein